MKYLGVAGVLLGLSLLGVPALAVGDGAAVGVVYARRAGRY